MAFNIQQQIQSLSVIFPNHESSVIQMALEASGYHTERASIMLMDMNTNNNTTTPPTTTQMPKQPSILPTNFLLLPGMTDYVPNNPSPTSHKSSVSFSNSNIIATTIITPDTDNNTNNLSNITNSVVNDTASTHENASVNVVSKINPVNNDDDDEDDDESDDDGMLFRP